MSNAQRLTAATDTANNVQFASFASYAATGALQGMTSGKINGGFSGISETHTYNTSLEYKSTQATSSAGTAMNLTLNYNLSTGDNGTVTQITNNVDNNRTQNFAYDPLNRVTSATTQGTSGIDCWGLNFAPDSLANLNAMTPTQCSPGSLSVTVDGNNHINSSTAFAYDAAGNMTKDGSSLGYTFDDENHLTIASGMNNGPYCYVYDGNGLRVAKKSNSTSTCSTGTIVKLYWRSLSGDAIAETDGNGNTLNEYVFFAGRRVASRNSSGNVFYWFADQLGSTRTLTDANGNLCYDADFTPYGQEVSHSERLQTTPCAPSYKFAGYEPDSETTAGANDTGLDYAFARYYSSRLGRFLSTDPLEGSIGDLQSHNAYAYAHNNPLNAIDPSGMDDCLGGEHACATDGCGFLWAGDCAAFGRMLYAAMGIIDEFDLLELAFAPTLPNPELQDPTCQEPKGCPDIPKFIPDFNNYGLLSLFGPMPSPPPPCTLNIRINNRAGIGGGTLANAEERIKSLFGSYVGVNFVTSGSSDYTLNVANASPGHTDFGHQTGFWIFQGTPVVHPNNIANFSTVYDWTINYDNIIGSVGAHELLHRMGLGHSQSSPTDIMASPGPATLFMNNGFALTQAEIQRLQAKCLEKHPE